MNHALFMLTRICVSVFARGGDVRCVRWCEAIILESILLYSINVYYYTRRDDDCVMAIEVPWRVRSDNHIRSKVVYANLYISPMVRECLLWNTPGDRRPSRSTIWLQLSAPQKLYT